MIVLRSIFQNHLVFNCHCGNVDKVAVQNLMLKYGGNTTVEAVEKAAKFNPYRQNIINTSIIYIGNSELAMHNSHTPSDNIDF